MRITRFVVVWLGSVNCGIVRHFIFTVWSGGVRPVETRRGLVIPLVKPMVKFYLFYQVVYGTVMCGMVRQGRARSGLVRESLLWFGKDLLPRVYDSYMNCIRFIRLGRVGLGCLG